MLSHSIFSRYCTAQVAGHMQQPASV